MVSACEFRKGFDGIQIWIVKLANRTELQFHWVYGRYMELLTVV